MLSKCSSLDRAVLLVWKDEKGSVIPMHCSMNDVWMWVYNTVFAHVRNYNTKETCVSGELGVN